MTCDLNFYFFFFFNATATTGIYTLSLHDALPIFAARPAHPGLPLPPTPARRARAVRPRSEEHTSELQSHHDLVCRLQLEKKTVALPYQSGTPPPKVVAKDSGLIPEK